MAKRRPNFIFLIADELRADAVGCVDGLPVKTPHIDAVAAQGAVFGRCFAQHPVCSPSRVSFMTGWYPHTRGHRTLTYLLRPHEPNLLRYLKDAGYHVQWNGKNDLLAVDSFPLSVTDRCRERLPALPWPANPWPAVHRHFKSFYFGCRGRAPYEDYDSLWVRHAVRFLASPPEPFFLYLPLIFPHPPYTVEEPYFSMYDRAQVRAPLPARLDDKPHFMREIHRAYGIHRLNEDDLREIVATYWGMVTRLDDLVGELMAVLDASPAAGNTVVVITSDHGDYVGDYGLAEKWWTGLQDCLVRVPLIVRVPGAGSRRIDALTETIDVFPTIMELAGLEPGHSHFGRSLLPLISGSTEAHRDAVFAEGGHVPGETHTLEDVWPEGTIYHEKTRLQHDDPTTLAKAAMVRTERWKYVARLQGKEELYDLDADPGELVNRIDDAALGGVVTELRHRLLRWFLETGDDVPFERDPRQG